MTPRMSLRRMMAQGGQEVREQLVRARAQRLAESPAGEALQVSKHMDNGVSATAPGFGYEGIAPYAGNGNGNGESYSGLAIIDDVLPPNGLPAGIASVPPANPVRIKSSVPEIRTVRAFGAPRPPLNDGLVGVDVDAPSSIEEGLTSEEVQALAEATPRADLHALAKSLAAVMGVEAGYGTGPTLAEVIESPGSGRLVFLDGTEPEDDLGDVDGERLSVDVRDVTLFAAAPGEGQSHLLNALLAEMSLCKASDLHIDEGRAPAFRVGNLVQRIHHDPITKMHMLTLLRVLLKPEHYAEMESRSRRLEQELNAAGTDVMAELDVMYEDKRTGTRYRCNIATAEAGGAYTLAIRALPSNIIPLREIGLPQCVYEIIEMPHGLVVIAGATGAGKSTTQASMLAYYGEQAWEKIVSLDDPIEYRYNDPKRYRATFVQRQIGRDTFNYATGVKAALRQDPDVVCVAETRDTETLNAILELGNTGHLCFTTLHASSAADAIRRMVEMYDPSKRGNIAAQLAGVLRQVYFQVACPRSDGGVTRLFEAIPVTDAVAANIGNQQWNELDDSCRRAALEHRGITLEQSVKAAVSSGSVDSRVAMSFLSPEARAGIVGNMGRL
ncbi:MAG: type IV pilus twitching motility protein PilT [Gemmatimonadaceae bacterium]